MCGFGASTCAAENYTVRLNTGQVNPLLGMSYIQFAMEGLRHQLSQGAGGWTVEPGDRYTYYKLVDSVLPPATDKDGHEKDFFDGIDTSLRDLDFSDPMPRPGKSWQKIEANIAEALKAAEKDPGSAAAPLLSVVDSLARLEDRLRGGNNQDLLARLTRKNRRPGPRSTWRSIFRFRPRWFRRRAQQRRSAGRGSAGRDFPRTESSLSG